MIGKIIGAVAGSKLAENSRSVGGPAGALLGVGAATLARRMSLPVLLAASAGGYLIKKRMDRKQAGTKAKA